MGAPLGWFRKTDVDHGIARKIATKLTELVEGEPDVVERHFGYNALIEWNYKQRNRDPDALQAAIAACETQIAISQDATIAFRKEGFEQLPSHRGFNQLRIIRKKQGDLQSDTAIEERANREGWRSGKRLTQQSIVDIKPAPQRQEKDSSAPLNKVVSLFPRPKISRPRLS